MKKFFALLLSCLMCVACFALCASAGEYDMPASLLPNPDGEMVAEGCDVVVNDNGSVTVTLTAASAKIVMTYKDGTTIYEEPYSEIANYPYIAYWYDTESVTVESHAHYGRKDKGDAGADLYLDGMRKSPAYYEIGNADTHYGAWNIYNYLKNGKGSDYVTGDYEVLKFFDIEYTFSGSVGDTVTFYYYGTMDEIPDGFGTEIPDDNTSEEESSEDEPSIVEPSSEEESSATVPSEAVSEEESSAEASSTAPSQAESSTGSTEPTSDSGIVALAVIASLAIAGAVIVKKTR